jgi:purine-binding chemotaxis protein CheW
MTALYLIAHVNGCCVGIDSGSIESIVHVQDIIPVPMCDPSIAGLFALRSRVLTLIDTQFLVSGIARKAEKGALAVVVDIAGHQYGLLVDKVEDVVSIQPEQLQSQIKPAAEWMGLVDQIASVDGRLVMVLDTDSLVSGQIGLAA